MLKPRWIAALAAVTYMTLFTTGCATAPKSQPERESLQDEAQAALKSMTAKDPSLEDFVDRAAGYAVFPNVGKAGAIVGGAHGRGILYEDGRPAGYVSLSQGSVGAQLGAQTYHELVVLENEDAVSKIKAGNFGVGAMASAVAIKAGAGGETRFRNGVAVFIQPKGGLMAEASINGQKINYEPMDGAEASSATTRPSSRD